MNLLDRNPMDKNLQDRNPMDENLMEIELRDRDNLKLFKKLLHLIWYTSIWKSELNT